MKYFFFFSSLSVLLFGQVSNDLLTACNGGDHASCAKVGLARMNSLSPDYDPQHAISFLKDGCVLGSDLRSCKSLYNFYSVNSNFDFDNVTKYSRVACDLHDQTGCVIYHKNIGK